MVNPSRIVVGTGAADDEAGTPGDLCVSRTKDQLSVRELLGCCSVTEHRRDDEMKLMKTSLTYYSIRADFKTPSQTIQS